MDRLPLQDSVALVTRASRGVGRGAACALGAAVYVTGRTEQAAEAAVPLRGTIHETAALVSTAGGRGIAVRCDHGDDEQVAALFARLASERGRLDLLVNNAWGGYQAKQTRRNSGFKTPFWKAPISMWDSMFEVGVRGAYVAAYLAAGMMVAQRSGLIMQMTATAGFGYAENVAYGVSKAAVNRMAADMAHELRPHNVAVVALCPFIVATEMIMARRKDKGLQRWMESPEFVGRAVAALATDPAVMERSGKVCRTRDLAQEYGFRDIDGHLPA